MTHTPARRLLRALLAMPDARASHFLSTALRMLRRVAVDEWREDVSAAFFWWSNVQQLRLLLRQLDDGTLQVAGDWRWLHGEMDPALQVRAAHAVASYAGRLDGVRTTWHDCLRTVCRSPCAGTSCALRALL
jgi:hypothetical protein